MSEKKLIEINGVKLEVDMRHARKVDDFKVGDNVKVLVKEYGDNYKSHGGVIVGFDNFENLPTIVICYCELSYSSAEIKFVYLNQKSKDIEICHMGEFEKLIDLNSAKQMMEREVVKKESELLDIKRKQQYFLAHYEKTLSGITFEGKCIPND